MLKTWPKQLLGSLPLALVLPNCSDSYFPDLINANILLFKLQLPRLQRYRLPPGPQSLLRSKAKE